MKDRECHKEDIVAVGGERLRAHREGPKPACELLRLRIRAGVAGDNVTGVEV